MFHAPDIMSLTPGINALAGSSAVFAFIFIVIVRKTLIEDSLKPENSGI